MATVEKKSVNTKLENGSLPATFSAGMRRIADQSQQELTSLSPERLAYLKLTSEDVKWIQRTYGEKVLTLSLAIRPHMLSSSVSDVAWEAYSRHEALSDTFNQDPECSMASRGTFGSLMQFFGGRPR